MSETSERMTVKQVAEVLGCSPETVKVYVKELFPDLMQNGKTTYLDQMQCTVILEKMKQPKSSGRHAALTYGFETNRLETSESRALQIALLHKQIDLIVEAEMAELRDKNEKLCIDLDQALSHWTVNKYNEVYLMGWSEDEKNMVGRKVATYCRTHRLEIKRARSTNTKYAYVNSYPIEAWEALYGECENGE